MLYGMKKNWRPKKWTAESALLEAKARASLNKEGAKRLALWALDREAKKGKK